MKKINMKKIKKIGFPCVMASKPLTTNRTIKLKNIKNNELLMSIIEKNINDLEKILEWMNRYKKIRLFRIGSSIIPFASHEKFNLDWKKIFGNRLKTIGKKYLKYGFIFSMHPGQYTVINSPNKKIVERSIKEIEYSSEVLECLGCDNYHKVIIHIGGVYNDKRNSIKRFMNNLKKISQKTLSRLAIENDEKNYSFEDIINISEQTGISPIFDFHHYKINPSKNIEYLLERSKKIWRKEPEIHLSSQKRNGIIGAHSNLIYKKDFIDLINLINYDFNLMIEAKKKEIAVLKLIN